MIGRLKEIKALKKIYASKEAEFIAIYGRRRIGKTYLVREVFSKEPHYFEVVGSKEGRMKDQLRNFMDAFGQAFYDGLSLETPKSWWDAFKTLTDALKKIPPHKKIVLFFDELPWLATKRSRFISTLDYYWNKHWSLMRNVKLIVCGSAAAWMLEHLINAKGGLHNRITGRILLEPFTLQETKAFLKSRSIILNDRQILDLYMVFGGVPYYLKFIEKGQSAAETITALCFESGSPLSDEFPRLMRSLFGKGKHHLQILGLVAKTHYGLSRDDLLKKLPMKSGGAFNTYIEELEAAGFIKVMRSLGKKKNYVYRAVDEYSLFYLNWIDPLSVNGVPTAPKDFWTTQIGKGAYYAWAGYTYENVCLKHSHEIQKALGLLGKVQDITSWKVTENKTHSGAQVDLLFDRTDQSITLCEIKYTQDTFTIDKPYAAELKRKILTFSAHFPKKQIFLALLSAEGLKPNIWSEDLVDQVITLKQIMGTKT